MQALSLWHMVAVLLIVVHAYALAAAILLATRLWQANDWFGVFRVSIGIGWIILLVIICVIFLIERLQKLGCDIQIGRAENAKGAIAFRRLGHKHLSFIYLMQIEGKEYRVTFWQMWTFRQCAEYSVYAAPQMRLVLSAELVRLLS